MTATPAPQPLLATPEADRPSSAESASFQLSWASETLPDAFLGEGERFQDLLTLMSDGLFYELGLSVPRVTLRRDPEAMPRDARVLVNGDMAASFQTLEPKSFLVNSPVEHLALLGIPAEPSVNPATGKECAVVREGGGTRQRCEQEGLTTWSPAGHLVLHLSAVIRKNAAKLLTADLVELSLSILEQWFPDPVAMARTRFGVPLMTGVLRQLLEEEIPIRDLRGILESLLAVQGVTTADPQRLITFFPYPAPTHLVPALEDKALAGLDVTDYTTAVRMGMKRTISHKYTRGQATLLVYLLDPAIEARIGLVQARPLTADEHVQLHEAVKKEARSLPNGGRQPVILTTAPVRRKLWELLHEAFPWLSVLSYQELAPDLNIQPIARITSTWSSPA